MTKDLSVRPAADAGWVVASDRMDWASGTRLSVDDLAGCNIPALVKAGHLTPVPKKAEAVTAPQETEQHGTSGSD